MKGRSGNYTIYKCIGKGAYGEVFLARYKKEKKLVSPLVCVSIDNHCLQLLQVMRLCSYARRCSTL